ncbi:uncharacterized protein B0H64DRAFT_329042 [Chaetomium fimeti]|uniref:N-acetyltransferase domain-containing protein n=1 Tax=Chaetomium fimeti TaxID=1854472 RepID=A0AAE0LQ09_9PEZI|nr:hypothetical protein B0H64DRAFT_329042 [Chaetomium fimeti]
MNCTTVDRKCQYTTPWRTAERSPSDPSASPQTPAGPASTPAPSVSFPGLQPSAPVENPHSRVDMVHMQLLHHYTTNNDIHPLIDTCMKDIIINLALREPYIMHSVLAISAHHLSVLRPDQQSFYHNLAIQLQTQALSIFNSIDIGLYGDSVEKRVPVFIFSSVLGIHALCDTLSHRDSDADSAISRFVAYANLHRGMHTVMHGYWDELRKTELRAIFDELVPQWFQLTSEGQECADIRVRLTSSVSLDSEEREEALRAVELVQCVFDAKPKLEDRAYVLCSWVSMLGPSFVRMLDTRRPEALAILAYYFLAMYHCRGVWLMDGAGQHFLPLIAEHFRGGEWYAWLPLPIATSETIVHRPVPMARNFEVTRPQEADAPRIAEIHLAAMDANPLLHAQFPAPESLRALRSFLEDYALEQLRNAASGFLVARDPETGVVAGFAKWDSPSHPEDVKLERSDLRDLEGCRREFLDDYASLAEEAKKRCFGEQVCYCLNFVCIDPAYQGQGAGSLLTRKVLGLAAADGLPVYIESTGVAVSMYQRLGFTTIDGFEMRLPRPAFTALSEIYREECMVWYPPPTQDGGSE